MPTEFYGSDWPNGSIVMQFDEIYRIRKNYGPRGEVEYLNGMTASTRFEWDFCGEKATLLASGKDVALTDRVVKLAGVPFEQGEKLIYEWVKNNVINFRQFSQLCRVNMDIRL